MTFFFSKKDGTLERGKYTFKGDAHFQFPRGEGDFAEAFAWELKTNPDLKPKIEQGADGKTPKAVQPPH